LPNRPENYLEHLGIIQLSRRLLNCAFRAPDRSVRHKSMDVLE
jgi:hypothetical protein